MKGAFACRCEEACRTWRGAQSAARLSVSVLSSSGHRRVAQPVRAPARCSAEHACSGPDANTAAHRRCTTSVQRRSRTHSTTCSGTRANAQTHLHEYSPAHTPVLTQSHKNTSKPRMHNLEHACSTPARLRLCLHRLPRRGFRPRTPLGESQKGAAVDFPRGAIDASWLWHGAACSGGIDGAVCACVRGAYWLLPVRQRRRAAAIREDAPEPRARARRVPCTERWLWCHCARRGRAKGAS
eukprot:1356045-Pleurochrysis_carterae.AAC.1